MNSGISIESRILGGLWGVAVGDALGVPVEFRSREQRDSDPVTDMRGYGTYHQPPGTWSDDTSLTLCTIDTLLHAGEDHQALARSFIRWRDAEIWTPYGRVFDIGIATASAIDRLARGVAPLESGGSDEQSNGNGSLMRIAPVAIWFARRPTADIIEAAHQFSSLTHRHPRSQMGCALFCLVARHLLAGIDPAAAIDESWAEAQRYYQVKPFKAELGVYSRVRSAAKLAELKQSKIRGSGYVVDALEASLWCLLNSEGFGDTVLRAVNLGDDTDTTAAITGALAGFRYGLDAVPPRWRAKLARSGDLQSLFEAFAARVLSPE